jgi:hypothetical protein
MILRRRATMHRTTMTPPTLREMSWKQHLKISWTILWSLIALLLIVLWARSYSHTDSATKVDDQFVLTRLGADSGVFFFGVADYKTTPNISTPEVTEGWVYQEYDGTPHGVPATWTLRRFPDASQLFSVPAWFVTLLFSVLATVPWIYGLTRQFSLRTLLITTTLIAIMLWLVVWSTG